jgi:outer membrane protein assembly factor BamB
MEADMRKLAPLFIAVAFAVSSRALAAVEQARMHGNSAASGAGSHAQWSMFKNGRTRTGRTGFVGPQTNAVKWTHLLKGYGMQAPLAIGHDGAIYAGSVHGFFYAFDPKGSVRWKSRLSKYEITSGPAIASDGTIYIAPENGDLYAFNPDGTLKWLFDLAGYGGPSASPAVGADGVVYVGTDRLYAIHPDGTLFLSYDTGTYIAGPPAIAGDGTVYFPSANSLYALDSGGMLKWHAPGHSAYPLGSAPAIGKSGTIYINTNDGVLQAFRPDGTLAWKYATEGIVMDVPSSPAIGSDETIYFGGGGEYQGRGGYLYAVNPDGSPKWKYFAGCDQTAPSVGGDGTIYFGSDYCGTIHALNPDGTPKWSYSNVTIYTRSSPAIGLNGRLYSGALAGPEFPDQGGLLAFGP